MNKQYSYTIDNIGRVHIEVTKGLVSRVMIDDDKEFYYNVKTHPIIEDDFIIKVGMEIIRFSTGKITNLRSIPIYFPEVTPFMDEFYTKIMDIPYGEVINLRDMVTKGQLGKSRKLINTCPLNILIPTHRVIDDKLNPELNYYLDKLRLLESNIKNYRT